MSSAPTFAVARPDRFRASARHALALAAATCLAGCISHRGLHSEPRNEPPRVHANAREAPPLWRVSDLARAQEGAILLRSRNNIHAAVPAAEIGLIDRTARRLFASYPNERIPTVAIIGSPGVNAFAFLNQDEPTVAITPGMIALLGMDEDAWAALLGHEMAHLELDHLRLQSDRRRQAGTASSLAGAVLSAIGIPFGSLASDAAAMLAERAFSREDELAADRTGLAYLRNAGFDPQGAIRLQRLLMSGERVGIPFLSTHPGGEERISSLRRLLTGNE